MAEHRMPELLCPAGTMDALRAALHFGADAVYGGMKDYGLRAFAGNFDEAQLREAVALTHAAGKKFYLTMNILPFDDQLPGFVEAARLAQEIGVDAAIVSDIGAIVTLREQVPGLPIHVSTQASTVNSAAVRHYRALGCERVILAREVSIDRMRAIHDAVEDMELEAFVHGAACMAYSGRCLLSAALTGRSGNQGTCAQPCRWQYAVMEQKRPGEYLPVSEDKNGTYIFSARDLNLMPLLPELCRAGIASLKIEGRMKTEYYVAVVTGAYRRALDLLAEGEDAFRRIESEVLAGLCLRRHAVIACGGGAVLLPGNRTLLRQNALVIWLRRSPDQLALEGRPLSARCGIEALYAAREPLYREVCDLTVDNDTLPEEAARAIVRAAEMPWPVCMTACMK